MIEDEKIIEMYHWYELNGIEITEPHMKFFYDSTDRTINPIYYSNPLLNVEFDTDNDPNEFLQNDMLQYALTWIQNIKDKDYYLESEQIYMNDEKIGTYHVDYNDNGEIGNVELSPADSDNKMKFQIGKDDYGKEVTPTYSVTETMDPIRPYLKRKTIIIRNINYTYVDYTTIPGVETEYHVIGSLALERQINTQIPDEDQAIDWEAGN